MTRRTQIDSLGRERILCEGMRGGAHYAGVRNGRPGSPCACYATGEGADGKPYCSWHHPEKAAARRLRMGWDPEARAERLRADAAHRHARVRALELAAETLLRVDRVPLGDAHIALLVRGEIEEIARKLFARAARLKARQPPAPIPSPATPRDEGWLTWTGPCSGDLDRLQEVVSPPLPPDRWPFGPPSAHAEGCRLFTDGRLCDCDQSVQGEDG